MVPFVGVLGFEGGLGGAAAGPDLGIRLLGLLPSERVRSNGGTPSPSSISLTIISLMHASGGDDRRRKGLGLAPGA